MAKAPRSLPGYTAPSSGAGQVIQELSVVLSVDLTKFRAALREAVAEVRNLGREMTDALGGSVSSADIIQGGLTAALAAAGVQASRTQIDVSRALQAISRDAKDASNQLSGAARAMGALGWSGGGGAPAAAGPAIGAAGAAAAAAVAGAAAGAIDTYNVGGTYVTASPVWRIRQAELRRKAEGTPPGSKEWQAYEEARRAAGLGDDPSVPRPQGVSTIPHPHQQIGGAAQQMTAQQAAMVAAAVAAGRVTSPDPRVRLDGDLPREMTDSGSARLARDLEEAAGMRRTPPSSAAPPGYVWDETDQRYMPADQAQRRKAERLKSRARSRVFSDALTGDPASAGATAEEAIEDAMQLGAEIERTEQKAKKATAPLAMLGEMAKGLGHAFKGGIKEVISFGLSVVGLGALVAPVLEGLSALSASVTGVTAALAAAVAPWVAIGAALAAFLALLAAANWDRLRDLVDFANDRWSEVLGERFDRIAAAWQRLIGAFQGAGGELWERIKEPLHRLGAALEPIFVVMIEGAIRALDAIGAAVEGIVLVLGDVVLLIKSIIEGDWKGVWEAMQLIAAHTVGTLIEIVAALVPELFEPLEKRWRELTATLDQAMQTAATGVGSAIDRTLGYFAALPERVTAYVAATVEGVQTWFGDKLDDALAGVREKVDLVVGVFAKAYDVLVGNSIVPDLVDEIGVQFERLGAVMVKPAKEASEAVIDCFGKQQQKVEEAVSETMDTVREGLRRGLEDLIRGDLDLGDWISQIVTSLGDQAINRAVDLLMEQLDGLLQAMERALGDLLGGMFGGAANDNGLLSGIGKALGSLFGGGRARGIAAGPVFPGRIYDVGEFGPEKFMPASPGYVLNDNDMRRMGGGQAVVNHFHFPPGTDARSFQASRGQIEAMMLRAGGRGRRFS